LGALLIGWSPTAHAEHSSAALFVSVTVQNRCIVDAPSVVAQNDVQHDSTAEGPRFGLQCARPPLLRTQVGNGTPHFGVAGAQEIAASVQIAREQGKAVVMTLNF
jgi:hypothetical protein